MLFDYGIVVTNVTDTNSTFLLEPMKLKMPMMKPWMKPKKMLLKTAATRTLVTPTMRLWYSVVLNYSAYIKLSPLKVSQR
jgi:hypothetical protein